MFIDGEWTSIDKEETREQKYIYPIIASAITSYARQYMFSIIDSMDYEQFIYMNLYLNSLTNQLKTLGVNLKDELDKYNKTNEKPIEENKENS